MVEQDNYTLRNRFFNKNAQLTFTNKHFWQTCNAAVTNVCRQLALWRMSYLPVHKELSADRLQKKKKKLSQRLSKSYFFFFFLAERGDPWAKGVWGGQQESPFPSRGFLVNVQKRGENSIPKFFYQFQTHSRQSPSGYVPACPARARRMAREATITDPEWQYEQPVATRSRVQRPITVADKYKNARPSSSSPLCWQCTE